MYGFPPDFNLGSLVGHTLEMICFAQSDIYFHLGDDIIITVGSHIKFDEVIHEIPLKEASFINIIGSIVVSASANQDGDLVLHFEGGESIAILDSESSFESYSIKVGDKTVFI